MEPGPACARFPALLSLCRAACVALGRPRATPSGSWAPAAPLASDPAPQRVLLGHAAGICPPQSLLCPAACSGVTLHKHMLPKRHHLLAAFCLWVCDPRHMVPRPCPLTSGHITFYVNMRNVSSLLRRRHFRRTFPEGAAFPAR